ncbi:hypothetical protein [Lactococcus cremoris]|uniref:hypothetical protein n=1 Tax=Lactococcus lactis subsp. cremoris TaxID=1359 RepID=UPI00223C1CA3|nr:hypothetical protein [Lactococcus cremoris]
MDNKQFKKENLFFCYDSNLKKFIYRNYKIESLVNAINPNTNHMLTLSQVFRVTNVEF